MLSCRFDRCLSQNTKNKILDTCIEITKEIDNFNTQETKTEYSEAVCALILLILGKTLNRKIVSSDQVNKILNFKKNNKTSLELAYFMQLTGSDIRSELWKGAIIDIFDFISKEGVTNFWLYQLSHFVFFSTDFGLRELDWDENSKITNILNKLFFNSIKVLKISEHWDLLIEVIIAIVYLNKSFQLPFEEDLIELCKHVFHESQSSDGWFLTMGSVFCLTDEQRPDKISPEMKYSFFHTTLVAILLGLMLTDQTEVLGPNHSLICNSR